MQFLPDMHERRRLVIDLLRVRDGQTVDDLARELRMTRSAVSNHLAALLGRGLVKRTGLRAGKRRPKVTYGLAPEADRFFPQEYDAFAVAVLDELRRERAGRLQKILRRVGERWVARDLPAVMGLSGRMRFERATTILAERGFMPVLTHVGRGYELRHHNCPVQRVGNAHPEVCDAVRRWIEALFGASVVQSACMSRSQPYCAYAIGRTHSIGARRSTAGAG